MSGKQGRSGGARPNSGPPRQVQKKIKDASKEPLGFLLSVMCDSEVDDRLRVRAAVAAAQYVHVKLGDAGKKDERQRAAEKAATGKFAAAAAPRLVVNNK